MAQVRMIEASSEIGAGKRGASMGMAALRVAAWKLGSALFQDVEETIVPNENEVLYERDTTPMARHINGLTRFEQQLAYTVDKWLRRSNVTIVIGGDHSIAIGSVSGTRSAFPDKRLGVVWVDAHADLHSPYTTPSGNVHGMPLAVLLDIENERRRRNDPNEATQELWDQLHEIGKDGPKMEPADLVFIALRDYEAEEAAIIKEHNIKVITVEQLRAQGAAATVKETLTYLSGCEVLHVSFDVDSLDPGISTGTGTPVPNGLHAEEASELLCGLMADTRAVNMDVVEINPTLDSDNRMAEATLGLLDSVYEVLKAR